MNVLFDYPARPTAQEAIRTVFATGALSITAGLALSGWVALGVVFGGSVTDALFQSAGVVFFTGFGMLAMAASLLAYHARRRYQVVPREEVASDGGESA
ncbi:MULTISPECIES: hypothetical protein [Halolamina]|uniref:Uncharacterized protein n=1 Tax=Halolamina pelagica TaxID=699431 RepID=A0A1I5U9B0_9EURY|nr:MULTISPECIES: hypothetical protein [Halolamina]NHX37188.1 hypothetical protein [Halolamina sp. R1-12]SFP91808.1 hypothetical protein SAMN05216277_11214 [Halolamina pelagica]